MSVASRTRPDAQGSGTQQEEDRDAGLVEMTPAAPQSKRTGASSYLKDDQHRRNFSRLVVLGRDAFLTHVFRSPCVKTEV